MDDVKVGGSEVESCEKEERICYSVGYPYIGQRMLASACFYWKKVASYHRIDCYAKVSSCTHNAVALALVGRCSGSSQWFKI